MARGLPTVLIATGFLVATPGCKTTRGSQLKADANGADAEQGQACDHVKDLASLQACVKENATPKTGGNSLSTLISRLKSNAGMTTACTESTASEQPAIVEKGNFIDYRCFLFLDGQQDDGQLVQEQLILSFYLFNDEYNVRGTIHAAGRVEIGEKVLLGPDVKPLQFDGIPVNYGLRLAETNAITGAWSNATNACANCHGDMPKGIDLSSPKPLDADEKIINREFREKLGVMQKRACDANDTESCNRITYLMDIPQRLFRDHTLDGAAPAGGVAPAGGPAPVDGPGRGH